jgi:hypothetical protein
VVLFGFSTGVEIRGKNSKKVFYWVFVPVQIPHFWTLNIFEKSSKPGLLLSKKNSKTKLVSGTKYVHRATKKLFIN